LAQSLEEEKFGGSIIRGKLAALFSLLEYLCENNAVTHNSVEGVKGFVVGSQQGKTPALADAQAPFLQASGLIGKYRHKLHTG
jgi:hypothetical protein